MRLTAIDKALAAANPVPAGMLSTDGIEQAGYRLLAAVVEESGGRLGPEPTTQLGVGRRWTGRRVRWGVAIAAAAAIAVAISIALPQGSGPASQAPAFGADAIRYAESSPLLLPHVSGWHVTYVAEDSAQEGEMHFSSGAELHWRAGPVGSWIRDRAASSNLSTTAPVLGVDAHVFRYIGGSPDNAAFTALWTYAGRVLEFRAQAHDVGEFEQWLSTVRQVDEVTWLSALPASAITAAEQPATVQAMLAQVPLPPGFDASRIPIEGLAQDRYQLGAAAAGTVACLWIQRWSEGLKSGNEPEIAGALAAMATVSKWPVLHEMESQGGYPQVLEEIASAMPSGSFHGYPLTAAATSALGCASRGVDLETPAGNDGNSPRTPGTTPLLRTGQRTGG